MCTTTVYVWAPSGLRGMCSGFPKSRELALFQGITFRRAEPSRAMENTQLQLFALLSVVCGCCFIISRFCITPSLELSSSPLRDSHGTQQSHAKLFPCTGHGRCFCVYVWVPCFLSSCSIGNRNKHAVQQSNWMLRRGQDDLNRHFLVIPRVKLWPFVIAGAFFSLWVGAVFTCRCSDAIVTTFPRPTLRAYTQRFVEPHPVIK